MKLSKIIRWTPILLIFSMYACSNTANPVSGINSTSNANTSKTTTTSTSIATTNNSLSDVQVMNVNLGSSVGLLTFSVKRPRGPMSKKISGDIINAHFIAFDSTKAKQMPFRQGGKDVGSITLSHNGSTLTFIKDTVRQGGVVYNLLPHLRPGMRKGQSSSKPKITPIVFTKGSPIDISISGSSNFPASKMSFQTANINELHITSPTDTSTISSSTDLNVQWTGGSNTAAGVIRILPAPPRPGSNRGPNGVNNQQGGPGMRSGQHRKGQGRPDARKPLAVIKVPAGVNSYTIKSSDLQSDLKGFKGKAIVVVYSQLSSSSNSTAAGNITSVFRNQAGVLLKVN